MGFPEPSSGGSSLPKGLYLPSNWGATWRAARATGTARIAAVGDSITRGYFSSNLDTLGWLGLLRSSLQSSHGDGGSGFRSVQDTLILDEAGANPNNGYPNGDVILVTGTWNFYIASSTVQVYRTGTNNVSSGLNDGPSQCFLINGPADGLGPNIAGTLTAVVRGTIVRVFYGSNSNPFTVTIDGGVPQTVTPAGGTVIATASFTGLAAGNHTVVVTATNVGGTIIAGFSGENATGMIVNNFGRQAFASGVLNPALTLFGHPADWSGGPSYPGGAADLFIYSHGLNDLTWAVTAAQLQANMQVWFQHVKQAGARNGNSDVLLILQHPGTFVAGSTPLYSQYAAQYRALAEIYGCAFIDLWTLLDNNYAAGTVLNYWGDDTADGLPGSSTVHPGTIGHALQESYLVSLITALLS